MIGGVHYPSNVVAGRVLGLAMARAMLANPAFRDELAKVEKEFDAIKKEHGAVDAKSGDSREHGVEQRPAELIEAK